MEMAKVTSKGQITIPVSIRRRLNINEGDKLLFIDRPEGVMMVNPDMLPGGRTEEFPRDTQTADSARAMEAERLERDAADSPHEPNAPNAPNEPDAPNEPEPDTLTDAGQGAPAEDAAPVPPGTDTGRHAAPQAKEPEPGRQGASLQGLDLNSLLNEIRSIGSNI